jgi:hypothetical protein
MSIFKQLADIVQPGDMIKNKSTGEKAIISTRMGAPLCYTWIVTGETFTLNCRNKDNFNEMLKGWKVVKE